jgi:Flp pilus assembly protein TadG
MRRHLASKLRGFGRETRGAAAVEFAMWVSVLILPILSVIDISFYVYQRMQVENAAQLGAQKVWSYCDTSAKQPATVNCSGLNAQVVSAAQSTTLGTRVTVSGGGPSEGYYCVNSSGNLYLRGAVTSPKPSCQGGDLTTTAGDYAFVTVNFTYTPVFSGITVASLLSTSISRTAWARVA